MLRLPPKERRVMKLTRVFSLSLQILNIVRASPPLSLSLRDRLICLFLSSFGLFGYACLSVSLSLKWTSRVRLVGPSASPVSPPPPPALCQPQYNNKARFYQIFFFSFLFSTRSLSLVCVKNNIHHRLQLLSHEANNNTQAYNNSLGYIVYIIYVMLAASSSGRCIYVCYNIMHDTPAQTKLFRHVCAV